jgi:hypothetical protein
MRRRLFDRAFLSNIGDIKLDGRQDEIPVIFEV